MNLHDAKKTTVETVGAQVRVLNTALTGSFAGLTGTVTKNEGRYLVVRLDIGGDLFLKPTELELA